MLILLHNFKIFYVNITSYKAGSGVNLHKFEILINHLFELTCSLSVPLGQSFKNPLYLWVETAKSLNLN